MLLGRRLGVRNRTSMADLSVEQIVAWADAYHQKTGRWPGRTSAPVGLPSGEKWTSVDSCLR